jgi:glutamate racemase
MKVGFYDSGIGGLTVLSKAMSVCPSLQAVYYADTDHLPYGEKPKELIREYARNAASFLCNQGAEAIVIACNTATSAAVSDLRSAIPIPVIGMEPAVNLACRSITSPEDRILVLATHLTLTEEKYRALLVRLGISSRVDGVALPGLVDFAEQLCFEDALVMPYLRSALSSLDLSRYAAVVLGCTHFPFFRSAIQSLFGESTRIVDGSSGTVRNLFDQLNKSHPLPQHSPGHVRYYASGRLMDTPQEMDRIQQLLRRIQAQDGAVPITDA